ncbi:MAG: PIG-L family deacetylase [Bryobacteraceae bacterium]|nr:PIG-L family deacetylase [Bryobacteraceae bacterium]
MRALLLLLASLPAFSAAPRTILAVGAHAGDMELTVGAVLARAVSAGDRAVLLHLTLGEHGKPGTPAAEYAAQKRREAQEAAAALGAEVFFGPWEDGSLEAGGEAARWLADRIREFAPAVVFTHPPNSMHKDHAAAHRIVKDALLAASIRGVRTVRAVYYAENWEDAPGFQPYAYFAIGEEDARAWHKAAMAYEFTHAAFSGFDYIRYYEGLMRVRGAEARRGLAVACDVDPWSKRRVFDQLP